jgi:hypothetical protein
VTSDRWRQIEALYRIARSVAPDDREAFFSGISADLRGDVEALLARGEATGGSSQLVMPTETMALPTSDFWRVDRSYRQEEYHRSSPIRFTAPEIRSRGSVLNQREQSDSRLPKLETRGLSCSGEATQRMSLSLIPGSCPEDPYQRPRHGSTPNWIRRSQSARTIIKGQASVRRTAAEAPAPP